jgi:hypothetical protein
MPTNAAASYQDIVNFATRNVWTKYNALTGMRSQLDAWRQDVFALEANNNVLPVALQLWDGVVLEVVEDLPSSVPSPPETNFQPAPVVNVIQRVTIAFRDSSLGGDAALEAAFVAIFNTYWT